MRKADREGIADLGALEIGRSDGKQERELVPDLERAVEGVCPRREEEQQTREENAVPVHGKGRAPVRRREPKAIVPQVAGMVKLLDGRSFPCVIVTLCLRAERSIVRGKGELPCHTMLS